MAIPEMSILQCRAYLRSTGHFLDSRMSLPPTPESREYHGTHLRQVPAPVNHDRSVSLRVQALWPVYYYTPVPYGLLSPEEKCCDAPNAPIHETSEFAG